MRKLPLTYSLELMMDDDDSSASVGVRVVGLDGCFSQGHSVDEAILNAQEAIEGWIRIVREKKAKVPHPPKRPKVTIVRCQSEWMSVGDVARAIGVSPGTVRKIAAHGDLPAFKFGNELRIRKVDLDLYIANSRLALAA